MALDDDLALEDNQTRYGKGWDAGVQAAAGLLFDMARASHSEEDFYNRESEQFEQTAFAILELRHGARNNTR